MGGGDGDKMSLRKKAAKVWLNLSVWKTLLLEMHNELKICAVFVFFLIILLFLFPQLTSNDLSSPITDRKKQSSWKVCLNFLILLILTCYNLITEKDFLCGPHIKSLSSWNKPEILLNNRASIHFKLLRIYTETVECLF